MSDAAVLSPSIPTLHPPTAGSPDQNAGPITQLDFGEFASDLLHNIRKLHAMQGPIAAIEDGGQRVVFLFDPSYNRQVLSDNERFHARFFAVRGPKRSAQRRLTCGLLAMNGEQHRRNRRIVKEPFGLRAISGYGETVMRLTQEMLAAWRLGEMRDIAEEMRHYMLRVTSTLLFGMDDTERAYRLGEMIAQWVALNDEVGVGALVPSEQFNRHYEELLGFAEELEHEILALIHTRRASQELGSDVLSSLVRTHDEDGNLTDEELVGQATVLFSAAHMTTAHSLTWTLFLLAQHPSVMRQLWEELCGGESANFVFPGAEQAGAPLPDGTLPKGEDLSLLDRIIKESMRILPASAYSQRVNMVEATIGPLQLPRGTGIVFTPIVTHRLPELYPQPDRFLPDRWIGFQPNPYAYIPFGGGPRLCIGGPLATAIIRIALRQILSQFRLTVAPGSEISAHIESTMLVPTNGMPMRIDAADGNFESSPISGNLLELVNLAEAPVFAAGCDPMQVEGEAPVVPRKPR
jgi:cytochrome P450